VQIYLVGGAVRDELLGLKAEEHDWVVVGATPEAMLALGFLPVGKEFPVFLHPETHEEYALARTERKISKGYKGFDFYADPSVTLEDDLARRDLTINAIAKDSEGQYIDPYQGRKDLDARRFRHVSPAFEEDPVRILRLARLACRFPDFTIDPDTQQLMQGMVDKGEVDALVPERVWKEWQRAMASEKPQRFFSVLQDAHALIHLFPGLNVNNQGIRLLASGDLRDLRDPRERLALALFDMEHAALHRLITRYRLPRDYAELILMTHHQYQPFKHLHLKNKEEILNFITHCDGLRRYERFCSLLNVLQAIDQDAAKIKKAEALKQAVNIINHINTQSLQDQALVGRAFAEALRELRLEALQRELEY